MNSDLSQLWLKSFKESQSTLHNFITSQSQIDICAQLTKTLVQTFRNQGRVFICGNGGSHCDAMHFAEELTGRYEKKRKPLGALALGDPSHITCVGNDYGFEFIFSRQLEGLARSGDLLIGLSTSGLSENVIKAFETAQQLNLYRVALLGKTGGRLKDLADLAILVPSKKSSRIQEIHIKILHIAVESVEKSFF